MCVSEYTIKEWQQTALWSNTGQTWPVTRQVNILPFLYSSDNNLLFLEVNLIANSKPRTWVKKKKTKKYRNR